MRVINDVLSWLSMTAPKKNDNENGSGKCRLL